MADETLSILTNALSSTPSLSAHLDEDTTEYILSILLDDPNDEDARDAVSAFFQGHDVDEAVCTRFFATLDASCALNNANGHHDGGDGMVNLTIHDQAAEVPLRRLDNAITLQSRDVVTFASGLVADADSSGLRDGGDDPEDAPSDIQSFYANMIDASDNPRATSERERRKARQRELRERLDEEERRRAIEDSARMMEEEGGMAPGANGVADGGMKMTANGDMAEMTTASDNAADVHLTGFNLANRKGGGPDLLTDANLTLASGRRYGLMGRNGCGKTTLLTALASRELNGGGGGNGVPQNMAMLLVRQEIMGNDLSAVETVLKSDVKREGVKRWIEHIERELNRLDNPQEGGLAGGAGDADEGAQRGAQQPSKGKQRLKDRKKKTSTSSSTAGKKSTTSNEKGSSRQLLLPSSEEGVEEKRKRLNAKLALAYERLARIEQEEGGDPEPRARKVLFGLGFVTAEIQDKPTKELSGGWRMRVSLSCALFADPALLL
jgi:ABC-type dipeptide/oligopeptide/nickel transport system ATPase subunit